MGNIGLDVDVLLACVGELLVDVLLAHLKVFLIAVVNLLNSYILSVITQCLLFRYVAWVLRHAFFVVRVDPDAPGPLRYHENSNVWTNETCINEKHKIGAVIDNHFKEICGNELWDPLNYTRIMHIKKLENNGTIEPTPTTIIYKLGGATG